MGRDDFDVPQVELLVAAMVSAPDPLRMLLTRHGGGRWHFPDGEIRLYEMFVEAVSRSFKKDLGIVPAEIDQRVCFPTNRFSRSEDPFLCRHFVTLHFNVILTVDAQLMPANGIEFAWFPIDSYKDPSFSAQVYLTTAEIFRRLDKERK